MTNKLIIIFLFVVSIKVNSQTTNSMEKYTVFCFSQGNWTTSDTQVFALKPDMNIRTWSQWKNWGTQAVDFNHASSPDEYHEHSIKLIGGVVTSVYFFEQAKDSAQFKDMVTRNGSGNFVKHANGAYRGCLANPEYREYVFNNIKLQIDKGVDGIFLDEVLGGYSGINYDRNEGFDDYHLKDFNNYLAHKYSNFSREDWINNFKMSKDNFIDTSKSLGNLQQNFNYKKYLTDHEWNDRPLTSQNPLAKEWGEVISNRANTDLNNFLSEYTMLYWEDLVKKIRNYAQIKFNKEILITSNGLFPFVDFNAVGMYNGNRDEDGKEARYVPVKKNHLEGAVSLQNVFKNLYNKSQTISKGVPVILFIDWPTKMMNDYYNFSFEEKKSYWKIYVAEAFANGLFMAFHLKTSMPKDPTAFSFGLLDFFEEYSSFYRKQAGLFHQNKIIDKTISISESKITTSAMWQQSQRRYSIHLVNHNYSIDSGMIEKKHFQVSLSLDSIPKSIYIKSPDYSRIKNPDFTYSNNLLTINIEKLHYYDIVIIDYNDPNIKNSVIHKIK